MNLNCVMIGSADPKALASYYTKLLGAPMFEDAAYTGWQLGGGFLMIGGHDQVTGRNPQPGRFIWNAEAEDVEGEFKRLVDAGAEVVAAPYHPGGDERMTLATLADPDGNYFQLASPMPEQM
jgi:predicted enzyme related to lactoylglutathione lyase